MADKRILMELLNMFASSMRNIGQQRQQGSQFRAGMQMNKAQLDQQKDLAMKRLDQEAKALASLNRLRASQIKAYNIDIEIGELGMAKEAKEKEARTIMGAEAGLEGESPYRTPEQWTEHPGIQEAGLGGTVLGMKKELTPQKTDYNQMKAAFDMSIVYGVDLPAEFTAMPGVVEAIDKGKTTYAQAQTDAERRNAIDLATAEANLVVAQWNAEHPGFRGGGGGDAVIDPSAIFGEGAAPEGAPTEVPAVGEPTEAIAGVPLRDIHKAIALGLSQNKDAPTIIAQILEDIIAANPGIDVNALSGDIGREVLKYIGE